MLISAAQMGCAQNTIRCSGSHVAQLVGSVQGLHWCAISASDHVVLPPFQAAVLYSMGRLGRRAIMSGVCVTFLKAILVPAEVGFLIDQEAQHCPAQIFYEESGMG